MSLLAVPVAGADVAVTSGSLEMNGSTGSLLIGGDRGFTLDSAVSGADGVFAPLACHASPRACTAGTTVDLTALWVGGDVRGIATLGGRVYTSLGSVASPNQVAIHFRGGLVLPAPGGGSTTATAPFTFDGTFDHLDAAGVPSRNTLSGAGTATLTLVPSSTDGSSWTVARVVYAFDRIVPAGWVSADIGSPGLEGRATVSGAQFVVAGAGADVWGVSDGFHFVFQRAPGDLDLVTRVTSHEASHPYAKAGLMMRAGIDAGGAHVILDQKPGGELEFMTRSAAGAETRYVAGASPAPSPWLRLRRRGDIITAFHSGDGQQWTLIGMATLPGARFAGLVVSSHDTERLAEATFSGTAVTVPATPQFAAWTNADVGAVGATGSAVSDQGTTKVKGSGADIWGTADAFHFVFRPAGADARLTARVLRLQNTNSFAKAGLMMRANSGPGAAHVILDMRPSGEIELMTRATGGSGTTYVAGAFVSFPGWLRLECRNGTCIGYSSSDGSAWTEVGRVAASLGTEAVAGLVVTSHHAGVLAEAAFEGVTISP